ncbi:hypothetical protein [Acetobacteroides hydrogenigenes]|uniref:Uncharacterized protein n=1 Tax=Acetobacteroides hydrogenigenes TaxID=979970 RepID=A0A4R2E4H7_9BACT|nr:hypothetical protein [Acetobacteroides hydrogenigenes]TCN62733.1 hypothetical protein CLV25_11859 [Acetobacteroides hydrogenigenes]
MNFKKFRINQTLLIEFVSVFLAVFLGFMANQWRDSYNNSKLAKQTVENIQFEIRNNSKTLTGMLANHKVQQKKIDRLMEIIDDPKATENITLDLQFKLISSNSWETAKLTQAVAYMDVKQVSDIAAVYEIQEYYKNLVDDFTRSTNVISSDDVKEAKISLLKIKRALGKIVPMESDLLVYYRELQKKIAKSEE